jgi:hypothetical protein
LPLSPLFSFFPKGRGKREEAKETDSDGLRVRIASAKRNPSRRRRR